MIPDPVAAASDQVITTLTYVAPGFVALKVFYLLGLRIKRSDLEWTIWSLVASVGVAEVAVRLPIADAWQVSARFLVAVALGSLMSFAWIRAIHRWPLFGSWARARAWDSLIPQKQWLQVGLTDGTIVSGQPRVVADSSDADQPDLYLEQVAWIRDGMAVEMPGVEGVYLPGSAITYIQLLALDDPSASEPAPPALPRQGDEN